MYSISYICLGRSRCVTLFVAGRVISKRFDYSLIRFLDAAIVSYLLKTISALIVLTASIAVTTSFIITTTSTITVPILSGSMLPVLSGLALPVRTTRSNVTYHLADFSLSSLLRFIKWQERLSSSYGIGFFDLCGSGKD